MSRQKQYEVESPKENANVLNDSIGFDGIQSPRPRNYRTEISARFKRVNMRYGQMEVTTKKSGVEDGIG